MANRQKHYELELLQWSSCEPAYSSRQVGDSNGRGDVFLTSLGSIALSDPRLEPPFGEKT